MRSTTFLRAATLLALTVYSTLALADPPVRVGRISLTQGEVSISGDVGLEPGTALLNWPVTSHNQLTTALNARTEFRIGSTSVQLDGDSSLEITELDDDSLRLRLHYGSVSVRVRNAENLRGFELTTPQGRVRLQEPGRLRVDAERIQDTTVVNVFDGVALVDGGGSALTVRAGKRAEVRDDDVRTGVALRDGFDDWTYGRDQRDERAVSARYVTSEMTGYEELDQYGMWRDNSEYGPLWMPRSVPVGWAPYRDGEWTWIAPWGWTWVDRAPWGYAPFHYGRWVFVDRRWGWAPGRRVSRPVWAPALVGWVGGNGWQATFAHRGGRHSAPAQGWYPLAPRDSYVPGYRVSPDHLRELNIHARNDHDRDRRDDRGRGREHQREGLTVVPHEQFGQRGNIIVRNAPKAVLPPLALQQAPTLAPPAPVVPPRVIDGRSENRRDRDGWQHNRDGRGRGQERPDVRPAPVLSSPGAVSPVPPARDGYRDFNRDGIRDGNRDGRGRGQERAEARPVQVLTAPTVVSPAPAPAPAPAQPVVGNPPPVPDGRPGFDPSRRPHAGQPAGVPASAPVVAAPAPVAAPLPTPEPAAHNQRGGRPQRGEIEHRERNAPEMAPAAPPAVRAPEPVRMAPPPPPPPPAPVHLPRMQEPVRAAPPPVMQPAPRPPEQARAAPAAPPPQAAATGRQESAPDNAAREAERQRRAEERKERNDRR